MLPPLSTEFGGPAASLAEGGGTPGAGSETPSAAAAAAAAATPSAAAAAADSLHDASPGNSCAGGAGGGGGGGGDKPSLCANAPSATQPSRPRRFLTLRRFARGRLYYSRVERRV